MCDRTKSQVLARELAFEYFRGINNSSPDQVNISRLAEDHWESFELSAKRILEILEKHDD